MDELFSKTSKVLRDNWVIELQKTNDYLKNKLANININPFFGYKIKIKSHMHGMSQINFPETYGIIYSLKKCDVWAMYKNEHGEKKLKWFHTNNIEFIDERFNKFFE